MSTVTSSDWRRRDKMRGKVAVIGVGMIKYGELFHMSLENMIQEAYLNCLKNVDKGIDPKEIKAAWFGQWSGGFIGQGAPGRPDSGSHGRQP